MRSREEIQRDFLNWRQRVIHICIIFVCGLILLGACDAWGSGSKIEATPTPFIVDGVNLSFVGNTGRPQFIYAFAKW
jgi:hypothetical protein